MSAIPHILSVTATLLLLSQLCLSQTPQTDIADCAEIQIRNANLHPALNGIYQRTSEVYNQLPVFQVTIDNGKIRYLWWNKYDGFTRWSLGTDKFSSSIEGFMDNQLNEAWLLGNGRSWHVVNQQEWTVDNDMNAICARQTVQLPNTDSKQVPPRGGRPPPRKRSQSTVSSKRVIRVSGAVNNALNKVYYPTNQKYDNSDVYKTDGTDSPIYIFHYSYDEMQRWYIGTTMGSDYDVMAFIEDVSKGDLQRDGSSQVWSEHTANDGQWNDNAQMKLVFQNNIFANNADQKPPPLTRDTQQRPPGTDRQQQRQQRENRQNRGENGQTQQQNQQNNRQNQRNAQQNQQNQQNRQNQREADDEPPPQGRKTPQEEREERRRQMFRRVNKLDLGVQDSGKFESGVDVSQEPDIIITGSDDNDINTVYFIQPVKYNGRNVYKSQAGNYLYFVRYVDSDAARWQIGQPNGGVKNDQPIAFVNSDTEYPYDIATWQAWLVFWKDPEKGESDWVRQSRVNSYRGDCIVTVAGAFNEAINGEYGIIPTTFETRPVFEMMNSNNQRVTLFFKDGEAQYSKWHISQPNAAKYMDNSDVIAFIPSSALTVDGVSDFESWQETHPQSGEMVENGNLKVTGTCSKVKEHDWKRRRRQRAEERKRRKVMEAAKGQHCPPDMIVSTDPGKNTAVVHWQAYNREVLKATGSSEDFDVVYSDNSVAPGSNFKLGRTAVTYELRGKASGTAVKCDFVITVQDTEAPNIQCPGDIYLMTDYNQDKAMVKWVQPEVFDNSEKEIQLQQIGGPKQGQTLRVGQYMVSYEAKDMFGNTAVCNFGLFVVDRQSPKVQNCPQSINIPVYADQQFAAYPEWDVPVAWDNVDGTNTKVNLVQGIAPGSRLQIAQGQNELITQITYEAIDSSDNAARCGFTVKLFKDESQAEQNKNHKEYHQKIQETSIIEESEQQYQAHMQKEEQGQDGEWSEQARRLKEERELQNRQRRTKAAQMNNRKAHRSGVHEHHMKSEVHDFEESLRIEDQIRDETNDAAVKQTQSSGKKPMTRGERRKKRREDRERRRKDRAEKRKNKTGNKSENKQGVMSIIFWSTFNFFWALMRPWTWPLLASIPLLVVCCCGMAYGGYSVFREVGDSRRGRRVPKYNSWSYKLGNMFGGKTQKQRV